MDAAGFDSRKRLELTMPHSGFGKNIQPSGNAAKESTYHSWVKPNLGNFASRLKIEPPANMTVPRLRMQFGESAPIAPPIQNSLTFGSFQLKPPEV